MRRVSFLHACVVAAVIALFASSAPAGAQPAPRVTLHNVHPSITTRQQAEFTFNAYNLRTGSRVALQESRAKAWKTISTTRTVSYRAKGWFRLGTPAKPGRQVYRVVVTVKGKIKAISPTRAVRIRAAKG